MVVVLESDEPSRKPCTAAWCARRKRAQVAKVVGGNGCQVGLGAGGRLAAWRLRCPSLSAINIFSTSRFPSIRQPNQISQTMAEVRRKRQRAAEAVEARGRRVQ